MLCYSQNELASLLTPIHYNLIDFSMPNMRSLGVLPGSHAMMVVSSEEVGLVLGIHMGFPFQSKSNGHFSVILSDRIVVECLKISFSVFYF